MRLLERYEQIDTTRLDDRASELYELLKDCRDLEALQAIGRREGEMLCQRYPNKNSRGTVISRAGYYKLFRAVTLEPGANAVTVEKADGSIALKHAFTHECGLDASDWHQRNETDRVSRRLGSGRELQPAEILEKAATLLASKDWREVAVGLIAATGRRPHEIVARAKFDLIDGDDWRVMFAGQGKKRSEKPLFPIATLLPAAACRSALARLRREPYLKAVLKEARAEHPRDTAAQNRAIDSRTNKTLNRVVQAELSELVPIREGDKAENCKSLRAAYLAMATERDCDGSIGGKMLYAANLAGHVVPGETLSDSDLSHVLTTLGYSDYFCSEVPHFEIEKMPTKSVKATEAAANQIDEWCELWGDGDKPLARHEVIDRMVDFTRRQLAQPAAAPAAEDIAPATPAPAAATTEATAAEDPAMQSQSDARLDRLESLVMQLLESRAETPAAAPVAQAQPAEAPAPKPAAKSTSEKNAEAMAGLEDVAYEKLCEMKGYGVSFSRCQRVYEAVQSFNEQYPDAEQKVAVNKSLLRAVDGCNNSTAAAWLEYFAGDIADYHENHGIENPAYHNRKHHSGRDFAAEVQALVQ